MLNDVKFSLRALAARPGFTAVIVLTLALGIGATTAIFSAVSGVMLRPLPYPDEHRLQMIWYHNDAEGIERDVASYPMFEDWRATQAFRAVGGYVPNTATFTGERAAEEYAGAWVTEDFFRVLGISPAAGVALDARHARAGDDRVIVLSHRLRNAWFGAGEDVMGRRIEVNGVAREVVGVMPRDFAFPAGAAYWMPIAPDSPPWSQFTEMRNAYWLRVIGRLAPDHTVAGATAELDAVMRRVATDGLGAAGDRAVVESLRDTVTGSVRPAMTALSGAVALVLLIACANIANLLLARGATRQREFAVRSALGASGGRLARQALVESLVLGLAGGVLGLVLAYLGTAAIVAFSPAGLPRIDNVRVDTVVIAFAMLAAVMTGLVFGLAPAWQARSAAISPALREGDRSSSGGALSRLRPGLVVFEVALALVLLVGAGLLLRSFAELQSVDPGFRTERVLSFRVMTPPSSYPEAEQVRAYQAEVIDRVGALPGVDSVVLASTLLLERLPSMGPVTIEGRPPPAVGEPSISVTSDFVSPGFFRAMEVPLLSGRSFGAEDSDGSTPVVIVNEAFVRRLMAGEEPLNRRFTRGDATDPEAVWQTIVGVVADTRRAGLDAPARPEAYRPLTQVAQRSVEVLIQTAVPPASIAPQVRERMYALDPNIAIAELRTIDAALADALATRRFIMVLLMGFAALALVLAVIGLYGVLAYLVTQRRREIGMRMALGAGRSAVVRMVLKQSLGYVLPGVMLGVVAALLVTRLLQGQLYGVSPVDPLTFIAVASLLLAVAMLASWLPARRAAATDPMAALRDE
jgi:putative ABC transport system permease protein